MSIPLFSTEMIEAFILVFVRVSAIIIMIPVFGDNIVPGAVRWGLILLLTMIILPVVKAGLPSIGTMQLLPLVVTLIGELSIGIIIGIAARFIFAGIQLCGELLGFQMGFSVANVIDPVSNTQVSTIAEFQYLVGMLLFLTIDAHHIFIAAITESYEVVNPSSVHFSGELLQALINFAKDIFIIAIKLSAPVMAVLLFTNVAMGVVARTVPQVNVFIISFPLQIAVGLLFIGTTAPVFVRLLQGYFGGLTGEINLLLRLL